MTKVLHTIGYEKSELNDFLGRLKENTVEVVADVRQVTSSRKKGFSKNQLREALETEGISYQHFGELGTPRDLRDLIHSGRGEENWARYSAAYKERVLEPNTARVDELVSLAQKHRMALLCFERDPDTCHRRLVAEEIAIRTPSRQRVKVQHIRY